MARENVEVPGHLVLPELSEILKMRQEPVNPNSEGNDNQHAYTFVVEHLLGQVRGKREWDMTKCFNKVSEVVGVSDEAFVLLLLDNHYDAWLEDRPPSDKEQNKVGRGIYTSQEKGASNKKFGGWTAQGIKCYNQLYQN